MRTFVMYMGIQCQLLVTWRMQIDFRASMMTNPLSQHKKSIDLKN